MEWRRGGRKGGSLKKEVVSVSGTNGGKGMWFRNNERNEIREGMREWERARRTGSGGGIVHRWVLVGTGWGAAAQEEERRRVGGGGKGTEETRGKRGEREEREEREKKDRARGTEKQNSDDRGKSGDGKGPASSTDTHESASERYGTAPTGTYTSVVLSDIPRECVDTLCPWRFNAIKQWMADLK
jgi:hypothetical protein